MKKLTIAAAQCRSVDGDLKSNIATHAEVVREASKHAVDLVVFPELSLTGYVLDSANALAIDLQDEVLDPLRALSDRFNMALVVGAPLASISEKPCIGSSVLHTQASMVYAKQHLHTGEAPFFSQGDNAGVVNMGSVNVGIAICADTNHNTHAQEASDLGSSVYVASVLFGNQSYSRHAQTLQGYAVKYSMAVVMANHCSPTGGITPAGRSAIWDDSGGLLAEAESSGEALVIAQYDRHAWSGTVVPI